MVTCTCATRSWCSVTRSSDPVAPQAQGLQPLGLRRNGPDRGPCMIAAAPRDDLPRPELTRLQAERLTALLNEILPRNRFYVRKLAGLAVESLSFPRDLARLPFTTKAELL